MVSYALGKPICAQPCLSEVSPTLPLKQFHCRLTDDGPPSSFQGRSSFSFQALLLQAIDRVVSLVLFPYIVSQVPQYCISSETQTKPPVMAALPSRLSDRLFLRHVQENTYTHRSFLKWLSTIETFQSELNSHSSFHFL